MKSSILIIVGALCLQTATAYAHIQLTYPPQRYTDQKAGPCGRSPETGRGATVTTLQPGATITVIWDETVNHAGYFRISFDDNGQDGFIDPADPTDFYNSATVLADNIADTPSGGTSTFEITLPNIECDNCTLQVIQFMTGNPPYNDGNDFYYQCADLVLSANAPDAGTPDAGTPDATPNSDAPGPGPDAGDPDPQPPMDGCCQTGSGSLPGHLVLLLLVAATISLMRRRRRA